MSGFWRTVFGKATPSVLQAETEERLMQARVSANLAAKRLKATIREVLEQHDKLREERDNAPK